MNLKEFLFFPYRKMFDLRYRSVFAYRVYFIGYCLTQKLRKLRFETDGTFDSILLSARDVDGVTIYDKTLYVDAVFDFEWYDSADDLSRCKYYIVFTRKAIQMASEFKVIPYAQLMEWLAELEENNYTYTWEFKSLVSKEYNLKISLICKLTTNDYTMNVLAFNRSSKELVCNGQILRSMPNAVFWGASKKRNSYRKRHTLSCSKIRH